MYMVSSNKQRRQGVPIFSYLPLVIIHRRLEEEEEGIGTVVTTIKTQIVHLIFREGFDPKNLGVFLLKNFDLKKKYD